MIEIIEVSDWNELISKIHSIQFVPITERAGNHYRSPFVFRGMDNAEWDLMTSLQRLSKNDQSNLAVIENSLLRNFRKYARDGTFDRQSMWYILAVAQHNGLPTRCLDWTWSPLVATHFACGKEEYKGKDGVIWCLNASLLKGINNSNFSKTTEYKNIKEIAWVYDTSTLEEDFQDLPSLDKSARENELLLMWEPPSLDLRIANQSGLFTILNSNINSQGDFINKYTEKQPNLAYKIIIKSKMKSQARDMLDQNNISERTMFPGLPGLCDWLKRYYGAAW